MSQYSHYRRSDYYSNKPVARSKIMGVCAGVAKQFGWDVTLVRIVALLGLFCFTVPVFLAYVIAGALFY